MPVQAIESARQLAIAAGPGTWRADPSASHAAGTSTTDAQIMVPVAVGTAPIVANRRPNKAATSIKYSRRSGRPVAPGHADRAQPKHRCQRSAQRRSCRCLHQPMPEHWTTLDVQLKAEIKTTKTGVVEFSTAARPASTNCCPHASTCPGTDTVEERLHAQQRPKPGIAWQAIATPMQDSAQQQRRTGNPPPPSG